MKLIYKLLFISMLFTAVSCYELDLQDSPNSVPPDQADIVFFYNNVQLSYGQMVQQATDLVSPVIRHRAMAAGDLYQNNYSPASFNGIWNRAYADLLPDIESISSIANEGGLLTHLGIVQTMKAHIMMIMVDIFGDIPYSQALQGTENIAPTADAGKDVYAAALALLNEAIGNLGQPAAALSTDLYYGGDAASWIKVANTLKIKYYLNTRLVDAGTSTAGINEVIAGGNFIAAAADDFVLEAGLSRENPDSRHPWYGGAYETGGPYMSNYFMWSLLEEKGFEDPRLRYYFYRQDCDTTDEDQFTLACVNAPRPNHYTGDYPWCVASEMGWWGRDHGNADGIPPDGQKRTVYGLYPAGGKFDADDCAHVQNSGTDGAKGQGIVPVILSSYTHFMLAEAALTIGTTGDARTYLEEGVRQSFAKVAGFGSRGPVDAAFAIDDTKVDDYVAYVLNAYDTAADADARLGVIMKEYHLASFGNSMESYNGYRRTSHPKGMQPTREPNPGAFTRSMWYPSNYVDQNSSASQKGSVDVKVFWDTNPDALN